MSETSKDKINLILPVIGEIEPDGEYPLYLMDDDLPIEAGNLFQAIHADRRYRNENGPMKQIIKETRDQRFELLDEEEKKLHGLIKNGRVRVSALINSPGGNDLKSRRIGNFLKEVSDEGGEIYTFGSGDIASAAAKLFMIPPVDKRFIHPKSEFMMHVGSNSTIASEEEEDDPNVKAHIASERKHELQEISDTLLRDVKEEHRDLLIRAIEESQSDPKNNPDYAIPIPGKSMVLLGLAEEVRNHFDKLLDVNSIETLEGADLTVEITEFLFPSNTGSNRLEDLLYDMDLE